jgi:hypothetical protein
VFQLDQLRAHIAMLEGLIGEGKLKVKVDWLNGLEGGATGSAPTVYYTINLNGHEVQSNNPVPVTHAPATLAGELRTALVGFLPNQVIESLIDRIRDSSVFSP